MPKTVGRYDFQIRRRFRPAAVGWRTLSISPPAEAFAFTTANLAEVRGSVIFWSEDAEIIEIL